MTGGGEGFFTDGNAPSVQNDEVDQNDRIDQNDRVEEIYRIS